MRRVTCFVLAAALAAAPAAAQNEPVAENAVDATATTTLPVDENATVATNDVAALPPAEPVAAEPVAAPAPAPRSSGGFPWGVIGLVGLVGLLGRRRRD
jgi:MYXO-CTERM domain-containing protein